MKLSEMVVDYVTHTGEVIGRAKRQVYNGRADGKPIYREVEVLGLVYGRELASGAFQFYTISSGSIKKLGTMKSQDMDWTEALRK